MPAKMDFTQRESHITDLVVAGMTNTQIAEQLCISKTTVKFHITNILRKAGLKSRLGLIRLAYMNRHRGTDLTLPTGKNV